MSTGGPLPQDWIDTVWTVLLLGARIAPALVLLPPPLSRVVPASARVPLLIMLVLAILPHASVQAGTALVPALGTELVRGLFVALTVQCAIEVLRVAGVLLDTASGRGSFGAGDTGAGGGGLGPVLGLIGLSLFLSFGGAESVVRAHHVALGAVPLGIPLLDPDAVATSAVRQVSVLLLVGTGMMLPIWSALLVVELGIGWAQRTLPGLPAFLLAMPARATVAWLLLAAALDRLLPLFLQHVIDWFDLLPTQLP
ncbi:MAG: type III secretion protein [Deltaproteobacteria bacterium]|nr:MAG: type III secretion protein [Deltaproteobacteria bacterium]